MECAVAGMEDVGDAKSRFFSFSSLSAPEVGDLAITPVAARFAESRRLHNIVR